MRSKQEYQDGAYSLKSGDLSIHSVTPAKAGVFSLLVCSILMEILAFAGMTKSFAKIPRKQRYAPT